jgi:hypothetical protein
VSHFYPGEAWGQHKPRTGRASSIDEKDDALSGWQEKGYAHNLKYGEEGIDHGFKATPRYLLEYSCSY